MPTGNKDNSEDGKKQRTTSTSTGKGKGGKKVKENWKCEVCTQVFSKDDDKVVQCEYCNKFYCIKCLEISDNEYNSFSNPALHWFCPKCETKVMKNLRVDQEVEARCKAFFKMMEDRMNKLESDIKEKPSVSQVESMIADALSTQAQGHIDNTSKDSETIEETINSKVSEIRDSAAREKNIIVFGIDESEATEASERKEDDTNVMIDLFKAVEVDPDTIKNVVRLGKKKKPEDFEAEGEIQVAKARPVKVTLLNVESKQLLMKSLSKLKNTPPESKLRNLSVTHDMSQAERDKNKEKVLEAKALNEKEKSGKVKFIVKGPPWERKVVKIRVKTD